VSVQIVVICNVLLIVIHRGVCHPAVCSVCWNVSTHTKWCLVQKDRWLLTVLWRFTTTWYIA